jgi:hypothetical protein
MLGRMERARFAAAPLDTATRVITVLFLAVITLVMLLAAYASIMVGRSVATIVVLLGGVVVIGSAWGFAPRRFEVDDGRLRVRRRGFGGKEFGLEGQAKRVEPSRLLGIRLLGSGGAFGWYGLFWNRSLGRYRAYVTDRSRIVEVGTDQGMVVLSPDDPDRFLRTAGQ